MSIYDYSVPTPDGTDLDLKQYEGLSLIHI